MACNCKPRHTRVESPEEARQRWEREGGWDWYEVVCQKCGAAWETMSDRAIEDRRSEEFHSHWERWQSERRRD